MAIPRTFNELILRVKRADTAPTRMLKAMLRALNSPSLPPLPRLLRAPLRFLYELHYLRIQTFRTLWTLIYRIPLFQSRCASWGRNVVMSGNLPFVTGPVEIHVGDGVNFGGNISIFSGRMIDRPQLVLGNRCTLSWGVAITVNREVIIEEDVWIPHDVRISDSDGHPREMDLRLAMKPPHMKDIRPVRICRGAWIGNGSHIMKGVTIGEGAVIGANSVVVSNVPAYALAMGNPAEVMVRNFGIPTTMRKQKPDEAAGAAAAQ